MLWSNGDSKPGPVEENAFTTGFLSLYRYLGDAHAAEGNRMSRISGDRGNKVPILREILCHSDRAFCFLFDGIPR
jgi:hypothetical protein